MRTRWMAALVVLAAAAGITNAQPAQPTVEFRLRSVEDLLGKAEYIGALAGKEDVIKQVRAIVKQLSGDGKEIEGLDLKRPFGAYATLTPDVASSPVTLMVPVADEKRFLTMLKERAQVDPKKNDDGTYKVALPDDVKKQALDTVYLRFANDYVYVGRTAKDLDPKLLLAPKTFFAKDDGSVGSLLVRIDTIPADLRKFLIGQFELGYKEQGKKENITNDPVGKAVYDWFGDLLIGGIKTFLEDAKEINVRVFIDDKADDLSVEATLTAKPGTTLAKNIASLGGQTSLPAGIVASKDAAVRFSAKAALPEDAKKQFGKVVDNMAAEILKNANGGERDAIEKLINTLSPTLKAAEIDMAASFIGPDAKGRHTLLVALAVKEGKKIEELAKEFAGFAGGAADFKFDIEKINGFALHSVTINDVPEEVEKIFGGKTIWIATSDKVIVASIEPDGTAIKAGLKAAAVSVPALSVEVSAAKLFPLVAQNSLKPDEIKALLKDAFGPGSAAGKDTVTITINGGKELTAKAKVKGKAVQLLFSLEQFKIK